MRCLTWMLIAAGVIGCGGRDNPGPAKSQLSSKSPEITVPREVEVFFERGQLAKAIEKLTELIEKTPHDSQLYSLRASACQRQGKQTEALADLDHAISINGSDARLYNNRGFIYLGMEKFDEAWADFNKATEIDSRYMNAYNNRGLLYIAQKKFTAAVRQFNIAIQIDPQYVDAYNNRGFAEFELGQIEQALDDFNLAISMDANYVNAFNNRGLLRARAGDFENAIVDFTHAMMIDPLNPKYYEHRRNVYQRLGAPEKARADQKKIEWLTEYRRLTVEMSQSTNSARELIQRAQLLMQINDDDSALRDLEQAISMDPQSAEALATRAGIFLRQRDWTNAKADALASLAVAPNQLAYSVLGDLFLRQRDYDQAIENYHLARRVDHDVAKAYYAKAKQLEEQGQTDQARDNLQQAMVLDPEIETRLR